MSSSKDITLSGAQYQLMQVLWAQGEATAGEVRNAWQGARRPAHTTIGTVLSRLEKKGLLSSSRRGRERVFTPLVAEADVRRNMVSQLVGTLFAGDPQELLAHLIRESDVAPEDLDAARRLLQEDAEQ